MFIGVDIDALKKPDLEYEQWLRKMYVFAAESYNCFRELNMFKEAHYNLCNALELLSEIELLFNGNVETEKDYLLSIKKSLETDFDIQPYTLQIPKLIDDVSKEVEDKNETGLLFTKNMSDEQLLHIARTSLEAFSLPKERLINIINELKAYRLFHNRCQNTNIQILQASDYPIPKKDIYKEPIKFVLRSKTTGIETVKSSNIEMLLDSWNL